MSRKQLLLIISFTMLLCLGVALQQEVQASDYEVSYRYSGQGGTISWSPGKVIRVFSNNVSQRDLEFVISCDNAATISIIKTGDGRSALVLNDGSGEKDNQINLTTTPAGGKHQATFYLNTSAVPIGGMRGISLTVRQSGVADIYLPIIVVTLPTYLNSNPDRDIHLGPGALTYKENTWYPLTNGIYFDLDRSAGPLNEILSFPGQSAVSDPGCTIGCYSYTTNVNGLQITFTTHRDTTNSANYHNGTEGEWYYKYTGTPSSSFREENIGFSTMLANGSTDSGKSISFRISAYPYEVNSLSLVAVGASSLPTAITESEESVLFNVYANYGTSSKERLLTPSEIDQYFELVAKDGEGNNIPGISFVHNGQGYPLKPGGMPFGSYSISVTYLADRSKTARHTLAYADTNSGIIWKAQALQELEGVANSGTGYERVVFLLSSTSKFFNGVLSDINNYLDCISEGAKEYEDHSGWKVTTSNAKIVSASLSGKRLTLNPVSLGSAQIAATTSDGVYRAAMTVFVELPPYNVVELSYKPIKEVEKITSEPQGVITNYTYLIDRTITLAQGKNYPLGVNYICKDYPGVGTLNSGDPFAIPQGNGYWYSLAPSYLSVTRSGIVRALVELPATLDAAKRTICYVDYMGNEIIRLVVEATPKKEYDWRNGFKATFKKPDKTQGEVLGQGSPAQVTMTIDLFDKAYSLKPVVMLAQNGKPAAFKRVKVFYSVRAVTESNVLDPEGKPAVSVNTKGVLTPLRKGKVLVTVYSLEKDASPDDKASFYVVVR